MGMVFLWGISRENLHYPVISNQWTQEWSWQSLLSHHSTSSPWVGISEQEKGRGEGPACKAQHVSRAFWTFPCSSFCSPESEFPRQQLCTSCCALGMVFDCGFQLFCWQVWVKPCINTHTDLVLLCAWESHWGKVLWQFLSWCVLALECGFWLEFLPASGS